MSKKIIVTPEDLRRTANDISNLAADYESKYNQFYIEVNTLTGENWSGEDTTAFINQVEGFRDDFKKMHDLMEQYVTYLRNTAQAYDDTQSAVKTDAARLRN